MNVILTLDIGHVTCDIEYKLKLSSTVCNHGISCFLSHVPVMAEGVFRVNLLGTHYTKGVWLICRKLRYWFELTDQV